MGEPYNLGAYISVVVVTGRFIAVFLRKKVVVGCFTFP